MFHENTSVVALARFLYLVVSCFARESSFGEIAAQAVRIGTVTIWLCCPARSRVIINGGNIFHVLLPAVFRAPERFLVEKFGPVITCCLTMRAADDGWAARFLAFFAALSFFRFDRESTLQPIAANADRWAHK